MRLEAVIVCKNYSDFLAETLPLNVQHFDEVVVMTSHDDVETQKLCERLSVEHVKTDCFLDDGDTFNKGNAINLGISHLPRKGWLLHLDADIVLPHRYRYMLEKTELNPKNIYGADRVNVYGWEAWSALKPRLIPHYQDHWFVDPGFCHTWMGATPSGLKFGARVIHKEQGWVPIGYHQLWHVSAPYRYNYKLGSAAGADCWFPAQWPRENRILMPEVIVYHLDSELEHLKGKNWKGRQSRKFGPSQTSPEKKLVGATAPHVTQKKSSDTTHDTGPVVHSKVIHQINHRIVHHFRCPPCPPRPKPKPPYCD